MSERDEAFDRATMATIAATWHEERDGRLAAEAQRDAAEAALLYFAESYASTHAARDEAIRHAYFQALGVIAAADKRETSHD